MLVFDAKNPKGLTTPELDGQGFHVAFARDYEDADAMVIEMVQKHSQPRQLTVVSNDHKIQTASTRRNATAVDADEWYDRLIHMVSGPTTTGAARNSGKPNVTLSEAETQALIDEFSDLSESEINQKPNSSEAEKGDDIESESFYNPFPDGYGEDLLDS